MANAFAIFDDVNRRALATIRDLSYIPPSGLTLPPLERVPRNEMLRDETVIALSAANISQSHGMPAVQPVNVAPQNTPAIARVAKRVPKRTIDSTLQAPAAKRRCAAGSVKHSKQQRVTSSTESRVVADASVSGSRVPSIPRVTSTLHDDPEPRTTRKQRGEQWKFAASSAAAAARARLAKQGRGVIPRSLCKKQSVSLRTEKPLKCAGCRKIKMHTKFHPAQLALSAQMRRCASCFSSTRDTLVEKFQEQRAAWAGLSQNAAPQHIVNSHGASAKASLKRCAACATRERSAFSNNQWKKRATATRYCRECLSPTCAVCGTRERSAFSSTQLKWAKVRRCRSCVRGEFADPLHVASTADDTRHRSAHESQADRAADVAQNSACEDARSDSASICSESESDADV